MEVKSLIEDTKLRVEISETLRLILKKKKITNLSKIFTSWYHHPDYLCRMNSFIVANLNHLGVILLFTTRGTAKKLSELCRVLCLDYRRKHIYLLEQNNFEVL